MSATQTLQPSLRALQTERLVRLWRDDVALYARQMLGLELTQTQAEIALRLILNRKVMVKAAHGIGKTNLAAAIVNWFFDCFSEGMGVTTAPTAAQVEDVLWKEVRRQRRGRTECLLPKAPRLQSSESHFIAGYTARDANAFQGRHESRMLVIFDEAVGVDAQFWEATEGMLVGDEWYWLAIFNPTDTSSQAYIEELGGTWDVMSVSALDHPNVLRQLEGLPALVPGAVTLGWVEDKIDKWCDPVEAGMQKYTDFEFPPGSGKWYRPGPEFEGRALGRWPSQGTNSVWSEAAWNKAVEQKEPQDAQLEIGCDVARFGDDFTVMAARRGRTAVHHERHNGWSTVQTAGRLKELARELAVEGEDPRKVPIKIDDTGVGGGVTDQADGWEFVPINGGTKALDEDLYPNARSEMWFAHAERAKEGTVDFSRLPKSSVKEMRPQFMAPTYKMDSKGRRVVEPKDETKKRLKKSPDDADAWNLAFYNRPRHTLELTFY